MYLKMEKERSGTLAPKTCNVEGRKNKKLASTRMMEDFHHRR